jgi:class 3 adenylate cyclase
MHNDEEATHAKLRVLFADGVEPAIAEHGGCIVKNTGDGFLAEFSTAVEAVRAAMQFQTRIHELTVGDTAERRIVFRVGVNIGGVMVEPHDMNIAARLESIAEPGSICISSSAYDQVRGFSLAFPEHKSNLSIQAGQFGKALCVHTTPNFGGAPNGSWLRFDTERHRRNR